VGKITVCERVDEAVYSLLDLTEFTFGPGALRDLRTLALCEVGECLLDSNAENRRIEYRGRPCEGKNHIS
jgi:hypothetical protein